MILLAGIVFMLIPFIPIGYILIITGAFFLAPSVPFIGRMLDKLKKKDKKNRVEKAEHKFDKIEGKIDRTLVGEEDTGNPGPDPGK